MHAEGLLWASSGLIYLMCISAAVLKFWGQFANSGNPDDWLAVRLDYVSLVHVMVWLLRGITNNPMSFSTFLHSWSVS
jgi:hypothetical protein